MVGLGACGGSARLREAGWKVAPSTAPRQPYLFCPVLRRALCSGSLASCALFAWVLWRGSEGLGAAWVLGVVGGNQRRPWQSYLHPPAPRTLLWLARCSRLVYVGAVFLPLLFHRMALARLVPVALVLLFCSSAAGQNGAALTYVSQSGCGTPSSCVTAGYNAVFDLAGMC